MFGFIIASVSLVGLVVVTHHHRHHGVGGRRRLWRLLRRLDTTPGQEKVIRSALTDLKDAAREFGSKTRESRPALADILRAERVDDDAIESWLLERGRSFDALRPRVVSAVKQIHEVLDERQRQVLGEFIERAGWGHGQRHHYRHLV